MPDYYKYREADPLKLGAEHVPFPCSLRLLVLDRYGGSKSASSNVHSMQPEELLEYLKNIDNFDLPPWVAVVNQTEAIGDPAVPSPEQTAILRWLGKALEIWETQFPLEERIAAQVRRLKPLSAALAIHDPRFLQPGAHPLHQLLDNIQARAIGWQPRLDRAGTILEQQVNKAVEDSRAWFENRSADLPGICADFSAGAERDQARSQRMVKRVLDTEAGKIKTAAAKQEAARMINAALKKYLSPEEIGEFLKGPWYASAQLLLLKFGADSEQWQKMSATTETLLDSLQHLEEAQEERRQYIFEVVTKLPKEMRRWLLSLHHDTEAVNEAMALVEFAHLRILRRQTLKLQRIEPIVVEGDNIMTGTALSPDVLKNWQEGQWFSVDTDNGVLRVQLMLIIEQSQQLLFTNLAGIKVLQLSCTEFTRLMEQNKVTALHSGASFSLCLAYAVGIDSVEILDALVKAVGKSAPEPEPEPKLKPKPKPKPEAETEAEAEADSDLEQESKPEPERELNPALEYEPGLGPGLKSKSGTKAKAETETETESAAVEDVSLPPPEELPFDHLTRTGEGFLSDQAQDIKARGGFFSPQAEAIRAQTSHLTEQSDDSTVGQGNRSKLGEDNNAGQELLSQLGEDSKASRGGLIEQRSTPTRKINLPMGSWLGFHDGETPLMARLAVHDIENDYYIFVNREGVKLRQLTRQELLNLIDAGLVDILETISKFRDEVTEVRKNLDQ